MNNQAQFKIAAWYGETAVQALLGIYRMKHLPIADFAPLRHRRFNARRQERLFHEVHGWRSQFDHRYISMFDEAGFEPRCSESSAFDRAGELYDELIGLWGWEAILAGRDLLNPFSHRSIFTHHDMLMATRPYLCKRHVKTISKILPGLTSLARFDDRGNRLYSAARVAYFRSLEGFRTFRVDREINASTGILCT